MGKQTFRIYFKVKFFSYKLGAESDFRGMYKNCLLEFKNLKIKDAMTIAERYQSFKNTSSMQREFMVQIEMENQKMNFNMESPEADS